MLPLESYLKGVVPREVPAAWTPHAVRAQAVAARTYAAFERAQPLAEHYQICDTTQCQVYGGFTDEHPASNKAVQATKKRVLLAAGEPAFTQFSASNGGWTSAGAFDYLPAQEDPFDTAYQGWTDTVTAREVEQALPAIGTFQRGRGDRARRQRRLRRPRHPRAYHRLEDLHRHLRRRLPVLLRPPLDPLQAQLTLTRPL